MNKLHRQFYKTAKSTKSAVLEKWPLRLLFVALGGCVFLGSVGVWTWPHFVSRLQTKSENKIRNILGIPGVTCPCASPESEGLDPAGLKRFKDRMVQHHSHSLLVARGGNIVCEWYGKNWGMNDPHGTAALAKAITAMPVLLSAITEKLGDLDDPLYQYVTPLKSDPIRSKILLRDLAFHTSGIGNVSLLRPASGNCRVGNKPTMMMKRRDFITL